MCLTVNTDLHALMSEHRTLLYCIDLFILQFYTVLWRAWLHPWTQPVPAGWCAAPRGVHPATCTVQSTACLYILCYAFSNKLVQSQMLSLLPVHSGDPNVILPLCCPVPRPLLLHHPSCRQGQDSLCQPAQALHGRGCQTRQSATPWPTT